MPHSRQHSASEKPTKRPPQHFSHSFFATQPPAPFFQSKQQAITNQEQLPLAGETPFLQKKTAMRQGNTDSGPTTGQSAAFRLSRLSAGPAIQAVWSQDADKTKGDWIKGRGDAESGVYLHVGDYLFRQIKEGGVSKLGNDLYRWSPKDNMLSSIDQTRSITERLNSGGFQKGAPFDATKEKRERSHNVTLYGLQTYPEKWLVYDLNTHEITQRTGKTGIADVTTSATRSEDGNKISLQGTDYFRMTSRPTGLGSTNKILYYLDEMKDAVSPAKTPAKSKTGTVAGPQKSISDRINAENVKIWEPISTRSMSQKNVMRGISAREEVETLGIRAGKREWHWCHLIAHSMGTLGNPQVPKNLVAGTKECNGAMAHLEMAIKGFVKNNTLDINVDVIATLIEPTHVASHILYKVSNALYGTSASFYFYPLEANLSAVQHADYYGEVLLNNVLPETASSPQRSSTFHSMVPANKTFNATPERAIRKVTRNIYSPSLEGVKLFDSPGPSHSKEPVVLPKVMLDDMKRILKEEKRVTKRLEKLRKLFDSKLGGREDWREFNQKEGNAVIAGILFSRELIGGPEDVAVYAGKGREEALDFEDTANYAD